MFNRLLTSGFGALGAALAAGASLVAHPAAAQTCAERANIAVYMAVDMSGSMSGAGQTGAADFGVGLIDGLSATGFLERGGAFGFSDFITGEVIMTTNISSLRSALNGVRSQATGGGTLLYDAIALGAGIIYGQSSSLERLYVVLSDGADSGSLNHTAASAAATLGPGVNTELIYIGAGSNPMASMAVGRPHVEARQSTPAALTSLISQIVARTCRNFRPDAGFSRSPSGNLVLGAPGFSMDFDGSPSSDTETPDSGLSFAWTLNGPSRSINLSGIDPTATFTDADIGNWSVQLTVTDANGNSHSASSSFTVDGQPPSITATGPGAIDALDTLALSVGPVNDPDGGSLTFDWDIIEAPAGAALQPPGPNDWTGPSAGFVTTETDITEIDGTAIGAWRFRVIATDNEGDTDDDEVTVVVRNLPPRIDLVVPATEIDIFETIEAETTVTMDDDGGALILDWDIVQVPDSAGRPVEDSVQTGASFLQPTSDTDAGTWILRLRAEDNEGEEVEEEVTILVDGPVSAAVTGPDEASLLAGITLSGEDSVDPDTPCPNISDGCHSTDGRAPVISAGIVEWRWSIADLPSEHVGDFSTGPVDEVLGIGGSGPTLNIPNGALRVGTWRFELYVRDAEGNEDTAFHSVEVIAPEGPPFAIAGGPQVHVLGFGGVLEGPIFVNGEYSFDLDNLLIGDTFEPGMGITSYAWVPLIAPSGCAAATPFATPGGVIFGPGAVVPPDCEGVYRYSLTVTDDDATPKTDTAAQSIFITGCPDIVCIEDPTFEMPAEFAFSNQTDVEFLYKIDQTLYELAGCVLGCAAELSVFHEDDLLTPVFSATEFNPEPTSLGYSPVFKWNGFVRDPVTDVLTRPEQGIYTTQIELVDLLTTPIAQDVEEQNISISVAEPAIDPATDRFVSFDALDAMPATDTVDIQYTVTGSAVPDQVRWRLRDASSAVAFERAEPHTGTIQWNGKVTGSTIPAGLYSLELEILLAGEILGAVPPQDIAIYDMDFTLLSAQVPAPGPVANPDALVFVNSDDDNANGTADMDEAGSVAGEDDLGEYDISIVPAAFSASLHVGIEMRAPSGATRMRIYDTQTRATQFNFNDPVDLTTSTLPAKVFVEGRQTGDATLELTLVDLDNATDIASITRDVAIHAVDMDTDTDMDGTLEVTDDTTETDDMGMIVYVNNDDDGGTGNDAVSNDVIDGATDRTELSELTIRRNAAIAAGSTLTLEVSDKTKIRIFDEMDTARIGPPAADGGPDAASYDIPIAGITAGDLAYLVEAVHGGEVDVTLTLRDAASNVIGTDEIKLQNNVHREPGNTYSTIRNRITARQALAGLIGLKGSLTGAQPVVSWDPTPPRFKTTSYWISLQRDDISKWIQTGVRAKRDTAGTSTAELYFEFVADYPGYSATPPTSPLGYQIFTKAGAAWTTGDFEVELTDSTTGEAEARHAGSAWKTVTHASMIGTSFQNFQIGTEPKQTVSRIPGSSGSHATVTDLEYHDGTGWNPTTLTRTDIEIDSTDGRGNVTSVSAVAPSNTAVLDDMNYEWISGTEFEIWDDRN